ncbi:hypothetical protein ACH5RR_025469 [Cinchona calisaya]|uniref:GAG-pre-integrase domain-containing protein n=1 Tax=Cinchona calisaya TaxID=153742 RepID=A0ABD2Z2X4_9GENT
MANYGEDCEQANQANYAEEADDDEEECTLFMAKQEYTLTTADVSFLHNGCSNHMIQSLFKELNQTYKIKVRLGDDKQVQVEGKGSVAINNGNRIKYLHNVFFVPSLSQNLLSVGQSMDDDFSMMLENTSCIVKDKKTNHVAVEVSMTRNKLFPLKISSLENHDMVVKGADETKLWHLRYGHLNIKGLKLLQQTEMVRGLAKLGSLNLCESCIYRKQGKKPFPVGNSWRAACSLELILADLSL